MLNHNSELISRVLATRPVVVEADGVSDTTLRQDPITQSAVQCRVPPVQVANPAGRTVASRLHISVERAFEAPFSVVDRHTLTLIHDRIAVWHFAHGETKVNSPAAAERVPTTARGGSARLRHCYRRVVFRGQAGRGSNRLASVSRGHRVNPLQPS